MSNTYTAIELHDIEKYLCDRKFEPTQVGGEVAYVRTSSKNSLLALRVLSSVPAKGTVVRPKDADAIRVQLLVGMGKDRKGQAREPWIAFTRKVLRVNGTEGTLERIKAACLEVNATQDQYLRQCPHCGAAAYSDSGKCVVRECREAHTPATNPSALCPGCNEWHPCHLVTPKAPGAPWPRDLSAYVLAAHAPRTGSLKRRGKPCKGEGKPAAGVRVPEVPAAGVQGTPKVSAPWSEPVARDGETHDFEPRQVELQLEGYSLRCVVGRGWYFSKRGNHVIRIESLTDPSGKPVLAQTFAPDSLLVTNPDLYRRLTRAAYEAYEAARSIPRPQGEKAGV